MAELLHVVIPVRGGSVGIPGKNLQLLDGLPLVIRQWRHVVDTLAQLIDDGQLDESSTVTVATDDEQIAGVPRSRCVHRFRLSKHCRSRCT